MRAAFDDLCRRESESAALIDPYAATNPEEFFAVICETFFVNPRVLQHAYPSVYDLMKQFFRLNPAQWLP